MTMPLNNRKGTTLVELMVCLVLLALFGTAAVALVRPCAQAYISVQQLTRAQNLADALTETIRGELANADGSIAIVNAATNGQTKDSVFATNQRLTEGSALRFTVENNYAEVLDAGYVPTLYDMNGTTTLYRAPTGTSGAAKPAPLEHYLHSRFYRITEDALQHKLNKGNDTDLDCAYAYTTAYPNGDYMGLVISDLKFYARGWKSQTVTNADGTQQQKICLTSLSMTLTIAKPTTANGTTTYTPIYTQTAVIPLPGEPEFE